MADVPNTVKEFVARRIQSVDCLGVLFTLRREAGQVWTSQAICHALSIDQEAAEIRLEELAAAGLLAVERIDAGRWYRYSPSSVELAEAVDEFMHWFLTAPDAITTLFSPSRDRTVPPGEI